jgi:hypothetical protein
VDYNIETIQLQRKRDGGCWGRQSFASEGRHGQCQPVYYGRRWSVFVRAIDSSGQKDGDLAGNFFFSNIPARVDVQDGISGSPPYPPIEITGPESLQSRSQ